MPHIEEWLGALRGKTRCKDSALDLGLGCEIKSGRTT